MSASGNFSVIRCIDKRSHPAMRRLRSELAEIEGFTPFDAIRLIIVDPQVTASIKQEDMSTVFLPKIGPRQLRLRTRQLQIAQDTISMAISLHFNESDGQYYEEHEGYMQRAEEVTGQKLPRRQARIKLGRFTVDYDIDAAQTQVSGVVVPSFVSFANAQGRPFEFANPDMYAHCVENSKQDH